MNISALIPFLLGINLLLVGYGILPIKPRYPEKKKNVLKKFGPICKILGFLSIFFGIFVLLLQFKIISL